MAAKKTGSPLRATPDNQNRDAALDAFAAGAFEQQEGEKDGGQKYPWQELYVREDVMKQVLLKMPEPLYLKLKHIASYSPYSMTSFILEKIGPEIDREIERLTGQR